MTIDIVSSQNVFFSSAAVDNLKTKFENWRCTIVAGGFTSPEGESAQRAGGSIGRA